MNHTNRHLIVDDIKNIYFLKHDKNLGHQEIAKVVGCHYQTVAQVLKVIKRYWNKSTDQKSNPRYEKAISLIRSEFMNRGKQEAKEAQKTEQVNEEVKISSSINTDSIVTLEEAFGNLQKAILDFVIVEVNKKVGEVKEQNKQLLQENTELKTSLTTAEEEVKTVQQKPTLFSALRQKLG